MDSLSRDKQIAQTGYFIVSDQKKQLFVIFLQGLLTPKLEILKALGRGPLTRGNNH